MLPHGRMAHPDAKSPSDRQILCKYPRDVARTSRTLCIKSRRLCWGGGDCSHRDRIHGAVQDRPVWQRCSHAM
jgi:hypothetical protein